MQAIQQIQMRDLEKGTAAAAAAANEEEAYPLFREEKYNMNNKNSSSSLPLVSSGRYKKYHECIILFLLISVIALITALVPVSQSRITIMIETGAADNDTTTKTISTKNDPLAIESTKISDRVDNEDMIDSIDATLASMKEIDNEAVVHDDPSTASASSPNNNTTHMYVDYHTNRFDYSSSWCPNANCTGTSLCFPCQRRWLIIVTVGRTASTTLTKMMALLPGVRMTGENNDLVGRFENLLKTSSQEMLDGTMDAWFHNPIPEESWSCASQTLFTTANPPKLENGGELLESDESTILGFKTIRLFDDDIQKHGNHLTQLQVQEIAKEKVATLNRLFPCTRFVVNFRSDMNSQVAAWEKQFGATNTVKTTQRLEADDDLLHMFHQVMGPERCFLLDSTEWTQNITAINEMVDWLGFSPQCHFKAALEYNTKDGYDATRTEEDCSLSQECTYLY